MTDVLLHPTLIEATDRITVSRDGLSATIDDQPLRGDNRRDLRNQLSLTVYRVLHSGASVMSEKSALMPRPTRDPEFEELLGAAVPHRYGPEPGVVAGIDPAEPEHRLVVRLPEITASVPLDRLADERRPAIGETAQVLLDCRRPNVSPGFYYVIGSRSLGTGVDGVRRLFIHLTDSSPAVETWRLLLNQLEQAGAQYHAKILSARMAFPRRDALVIYLADAPAGLEQAIADSVGERPGIGAETSVFTEHFGPGVGGADDPVDDRPGQSGLSFGQHRSLALATALIRHAGAPDLMSREETIVEVFREARIDPRQPARNLQMETADV